MEEIAGCVSSQLGGTDELLSLLNGLTEATTFDGVCLCLSRNMIGISVYNIFFSERKRLSFPNKHYGDIFLLHLLYLRYLLFGVLVAYHPHNK